MALGFAQGIGWVATSAQEEAWCDSLIISGCTLTLAQNYNPAATFDDGSCQLPGCMDTLAWNFNRYANFPDASCIGVDSVGSVLKATAGWEEDGNGTDDLGFGGLPGGQPEQWFWRFQQRGGQRLSVELHSGGRCRLVPQSICRHHHHRAVPKSTPARLFHPLSAGRRVTATKQS